jgi:GxxExxY protein
MQISPGRSLLEAELTQSVIGAFYRVYNQLEYGFLESVYSAALARVLTRKGHVVAREVPVVVYFEGEAIGLQRVDMIVDGRLILEIKSTHDLSRSSHRQLLSYLRASEMQVGLLLHFGPRPEFHRVVDTRSPRRAATDSR